MCVGMSAVDLVTTGVGEVAAGVGGSSIVVKQSAVWYIEHVNKYNTA